MVLRRIDTGAIVTLEPTPPAPAVQTRSVAPPSPARTIRPPRRPEDAEVAAPIPLTRLHTPRAPFRSAIDLPSREEPSFRETTSASLPPLVATLPPVAQPIYLPASVTNPGARMFSALAVPAWMGRVSLHGALAIIGAVIVLGGVAVGRRIVSGERADQPRATAAAAVVASPPSRVPVAVPVVSAVEPVVARGKTEMEGWTPAASVESLPRATPSTVAVQPGARPVTAVQLPAPSQPAVQAPKPPPTPAAVASAVPALAGQASPLASPTPSSTPAAQAASAAGDVAVHEGAKDSPATEPPQGEPAPAPAAPTEVQEDPLMKAMRESIKEDEARRR
jgi:hypothetical protein